MKLDKIIQKFFIILTLFFFIGLLFCSSENTEEVEEETGEETEEETHLDPNEGPIYSYIPKDGEEYITKDAIERTITIDLKTLKDTILLGFDDKNNFLFYSATKKIVVKYPIDGTLGVITLEDDKLKTSEGTYIAGHVKDGKLILLQKLNKDDHSYKIRYFDISGNQLNPKEIMFSNIANIIKSQEIAIDDKYTFYAENIHIMENGNVVITINETSNDNDHIELNRPQFLVFNNEGNIENVIMINPPIMTGYGSEYWKETTVKKLKLTTAISGNVIYILWGSGYSEKATLGYMYQKIALSTGGAGTNYSRVMKEGQDKENRKNQNLPDKNDYISKGISVDNENVFIRLELSDGTKFIDYYNSRDDYRKKYIIQDIPDIGTTDLNTPNNIIIKNNYIVISSDKGIKILNLNSLSN